MEDRCCACLKPFEAGDQVVSFYLEHIRRGEKSGQLGFYQHENYPEENTDHVHFRASCLEMCFSPVDNPFLYDAIVDKVRKDVESDIRDEIYDQVCAEYGVDDPPQYPLEEDELPFCLWCKKTNTVWMQQKTGGVIFYCAGCQKWWDEEENELENGQAA